MDAGSRNTHYFKSLPVISKQSAIWQRWESGRHAERRPEAYQPCRLHSLGASEKCIDPRPQAREQGCASYFGRSPSLLLWTSRKWDYAEILPCKDTREASGASKYSRGDGQPGSQEERGGSVQKRWLGMTPWLFQKGTASLKLLSVRQQNKPRRATKNGIQA